MGKIKVMSELLANKIAAGEVVEKCVSIIKELVENSVDAKSSEIKILLKESGLREIKVIDNGIGMNKEDAMLAFSRHATSKLYSDDDLFNISSLGFRGEALPSIASVTEVELKTTQNDVGVLIKIKGGKILENKNCEARKGTTITVSNLFYNTPARLKHLSSPYQELANITEYVHKMALSYPKIKFVLQNDDKELINTDGSGNLLKVIRNIYSLDVVKRMLEIKAENNDYAIYGYISLPEVTRASKNHMTTLVNGRVVKNYIINRVINEAYSSFKEDTRYPIVVINISCDPALLDVNIHPSKLDIKFSNFNDLQSLIDKTIKDCLKEKLLIPKIEIKEKVELPVYEEIKIEMQTIKEPDNSYVNRLTQIVNMDNDKEVNLDLGKEYITQLPKEKLPELYPCGHVFGTYIVCQNETGMYLIDQHAAKERINYEIVKKDLANPSNSSITPIIPINIEMTMNEFIIIKENMDILKNINIIAEEFGTSSFRIVSHPVWFFKGKEEETIRRIFDLILKREKDFSLERFNDNLAKMVACKMSIKANTKITMEGAQHLINDMKKCDNPFNCPHGRPTIISFTKYELEKMFKRSI